MASWFTPSYLDLQLLYLLGNAFKILGYSSWIAHKNSRSIGSAKIGDFAIICYHMHKTFILWITLIFTSSCNSTLSTVSKSLLSLHVWMAKYFLEIFFLSMGQFGLEFSKIWAIYLRYSGSCGIVLLSLGLLPYFIFLQSNYQKKITKKLINVINT